jgi:hypothetical protein
MKRKKVIAVDLTDDDIKQPIEGQYSDCPSAIAEV